MPLHVVHGESRNRTAAEGLASSLRAIVEEGTVYLGYPVLSTTDQRVEVDALLVSQAHGLVAFLIADGVPHSGDEWREVIARQDTLFAVLEGNLRRNESLRAGRQLAVVLNTATVFAFPVPDRPDAPDGSFYGSVEEVANWVERLGGIEAALEHNLNAALQRVTTIKPPKKRSSVTSPTSRGAVLREIERGIANLDQWQQSAAIESPDSPQRIRGLAGSGKTVVLALKAAYWHAQHPDWTIALTFQSRALYQQIDDLVTRFTFEHSNDRPDPERLKIMHSWGSRARPGVYSVIAEALGEVPRDWAYARGKYGQDGAFQGICQELLAVARTRTVEPLFDGVLIDEAQDLPPEFFQLVFLFTNDPKRIVWGYDELQKLSEAAMPTTDELFGTGPDGESLVSLVSTPEGPKRDIVLPVCYRNTPWALATAHALGIGVYREGGLLQHPDEPSVWAAIGYDVVHGALASGTPVTLKRSRQSYPEYFDRLLSAPDAVVIKAFGQESEQDAWVAAQIAENLGTDELEHDDILVVLPDAYRAKTRAPKLMAELRRRGIDSHLVGVSTSVDEIFQPGSIAIAHIHRAKGNEAPMVYAIDSQ
jgi:superfamily I DNA and RNA helicase